MRRLVLSLLVVASPAAAQDFIRYYPPAGSGSASFPLQGGTGCTDPVPFGFSADSDAGLCLQAAADVRMQNSASNPRGILYLSNTAGPQLFLQVIDAGGLQTGFYAEDTGTGLANIYVDGSSSPRVSVNASGTTFGVTTGNVDQIRIAPGAAGAATFVGSIASGDLTANRTWTFPNADGLVGVLGSDGFYVRTGVGTLAARSMTSPGGTIVIGNADGVSANPTFDVDTAVFAQYSSGTASVSATGAVGTFYFETDRPGAFTYPATNTAHWLFSAAAGQAAGRLFQTSAEDTMAAITSTDDNVLVSNGSTWEKKAMPDCTDTGGNHLNYTASSNSFSCGTSGGASSFDPTVFELLEEFGTGSASNNQIGQFGVAHTPVASGTVGLTAGDNNHPGLLRLNSHASNDNSGTWLALQNDSASLAGNIQSKEFQIDLVVKVGANGTAITSTLITVGLMNNGDPASASRAVWIRRDTDLGDTAFVFQVCDASGAAGCNAAGDNTNSKTVLSTITPSAGNYYRFRIRRLASGVGGNPTIYFRVNDETEKTFCSSGCDDTLATLSATDLPQVGVAYLTRTTTGVMSADVDYIYFKMTGLSRY